MTGVQTCALPISPAATDGGNGQDPDEAAYGYPGEDAADERAPWL